MCLISLQLARPSSCGNLDQVCSALLGWSGAWYYEISPSYPVTFITRLILTLSLLINCYTFNIIEFKATKTFEIVSMFYINWDQVWIKRTNILNISDKRQPGCCRHKRVVLAANLVEEQYFVFPGFSRTSRLGFHGQQFCCNRIVIQTEIIQSQHI